MSSDIKISLSAVVASCNDLHQGAGELEGARLKLGEGKSRSEAMATFERQAKELKGIVRKYCTMLDHDATRVHHAAEQLRIADDAAAAAIGAAEEVSTPLANTGRG